MSAKAMLASAAATGALVLLSVWLFELSLERAALLAPVIVAAFGAAAAVVVLWARVGWESLRRRRRPWLLVAGAAAFAGLLVGLSLLGVDLPREG